MVAERWNLWMFSFWGKKAGAVKATGSNRVRFRLKDNGRVMQQYTGFGFSFEVYIEFKASFRVEQKPCYECLGVLRPRYHSKQFPDGAVR